MWVSCCACNRLSNDMWCFRLKQKRKRILLCRITLSLVRSSHPASDETLLRHFGYTAPRTSKQREITPHASCIRNKISFNAWSYMGQSRQVSPHSFITEWNRPNWTQGLLCWSNQHSVLRQECKILAYGTLHFVQKILDYVGAPSCDKSLHSFLILKWLSPFFFL